MTTNQPAAAVWPANVIHVNEDGWVLINRGSKHGLCEGFHLLVAGEGIRDLNDLFAPGAADVLEPAPPVLRIRRTYELLEVVFTEESCAIAIAARTPAARRPTIYRGPDGELLVWVPLPEGYTWPPANTPDASQDVMLDDEQATGDKQDGDADAPPERALQDDEPWEEALPLNSVSVGDLVLPAIPATSSSSALKSALESAALPGSTSTSGMSSHASASAGQLSTTPFDAGRTYDWMKRPGE